MESDNKETEAKEERKVDNDEAKGALRGEQHLAELHDAGPAGQAPGVACAPDENTATLRALEELQKRCKAGSIGAGVMRSAPWLDVGGAAPDTKLGPGGGGCQRG